jgi:hypothetical protein
VQFVYFHFQNFLLMSRALLLACIAFFTLPSCEKEKNTAPTVETVKSALTNGLTKTWTLSKLYVNGTQQTLTAGQARFTKTFKTNNSWLDSDGNIGTYTLPTTTTIQEITTNLSSGTRTINYTIKECSTGVLDVEYAIASTTYRLVFTL